MGDYSEKTVWNFNVCSTEREREILSLIWDNVHISDDDMVRVYR